MVDVERFQQKRGAPSMTASSSPWKRTATAPGFTPARCSTSSSRTPSPASIAHGAVSPLSPGDPRQEQTPRIAGALIDGSHFCARKRQDVLERKGQAPVDMPAHGQTEFVDVDLCRDTRPVPPPKNLIVRREDALVENLERRFQQRRPRPLQDHGGLLGEFLSNRAVLRTAGQRQFHGRRGPGRRDRQPANRPRPYAEGTNVAMRERRGVSSLSVVRVPASRGRRRRPFVASRYRVCSSGYSSLRVPTSRSASTPVGWDHK